jgi:hypothetical protein
MASELISQLAIDGEFSDITIVCRGISFSCHKAILKHYSKLDISQSRLELDIWPDIFGYVRYWMYTGKLQLHICGNTWWDIWEFSYLYGIDKLESEIFIGIEKALFDSDIKIEQIIGFVQAASTCGVTKMRDLCMSAFVKFGRRLNSNLCVINLIFRKQSKCYEHQTSGITSELNKQLCEVFESLNPEAQLQLFAHMLQD